jgi:hypothetical protein
MLGKLSKIVIALALAALVGLSVAYAFRNALATRLVAFAVDRQRDLQCTHPDVNVSKTLQRITLSALHCTIRSGPVREVTIDDSTTIELDGFRVARVLMHRATFDQRERDVSNMKCDLTGDLAKLAGIGDSFLKGMLDNSEMYATKRPLVLIDELTIKRAGKLESVMHGYRQSSADLWDLAQAQRITGFGTELVTVSDFEMRVTPRQGNMRMSIYLGKPRRGEAPDLVLKVDGRRLDSNRPRCSMKVSVGG